LFNSRGLLDVNFGTALLLGGDFFTGAVLASSLAKLVLRFSDLSEDHKRVNGLRAEV